MTRDESFITLDVALTRALIFRNFRLPETRLAIVGTVRCPLVKVFSLVIGKDRREKKKDDEMIGGRRTPETLIAMGLTSDKGPDWCVHRVNVAWFAARRKLGLSGVAATRKFATFHRDKLMRNYS